MNYLSTLLAAPSAKTVWTVILGSVIILLAVVISIAVAMQSTKEGGGLSSTITGSGSESFFGKSKTMTKDRIAFRVTLIASILFVVLVSVMTIFLATGK